MSFANILFYFLIIVPSAIIHEYAHGWMAERLGDKTARYAGRLTLNPVKHIDLWGTIILPVMLSLLTHGSFMFAYAKPVPYNPYNLRDQKWGPAIVGLAGPASNLMLACAFAILIRFIPGATIAPFLAIIVYANLLLMTFNLIPLPPLDGSKVLLALLPNALAYKVQVFFDRWGFFILLLLAFYLFDLISPVIEAMFRLLVG
ncbi:MAG: site-2 protease family protein [Candidatus Magasanikbacteria bacterium]|jgi:Zn-dependent protease